MDPNGQRKPATCRQIFPKDEEDDDEGFTNSIKIKEELLKDQIEFKKKYNYDPQEDRPISGKYKYSFNEVRRVWIGKPYIANLDRTSIETNHTNNTIIETKDDGVSDEEDKESINDKAEEQEREIKNEISN